MEFHFAIGPVQGFIGQARRTRDLWAGSFLLSWLSAVALRAVRDQGGQVVFPLPDETYMRFMGGEAQDGDVAPRHGGVPNRFLARVPSDFDPDKVTSAVRRGWTGLASAVWESDIQSAGLDSVERRKLWDRQVEGFWDLSWALDEGESAGGVSLLDLRKNLRVHARGRDDWIGGPPQEPGAKCMVMEGWQEMSAAWPPDQGFWRHLRSTTGTDLREDEQLCAVAWIKRRFVRVFTGLSVLEPTTGTVLARGWPMQRGVPSVTYMAACTWLASLIESETDEQLAELHDSARALNTDYGEWDSQVQCVSEAFASRQQSVGRLPRLDGGVFFEPFLENAKRYAQGDAVQRMKRALAALTTRTRPAPFYALLAMDGDSVGALMSQRDCQPGVAKALGLFASAVPGVVERFSGFLVYAGGDDVLAVLPVQMALSCAVNLKQLFQRSFDQFEPASKRPTISAAVSFVHVKVPLMRIVGDTHDLLSETAKHGMGRNALAVDVRVPGGRTLRWASKWESAVEGEELVVETLAREFAGDGPEFSSSFLYRIREVFETLNPAPDEAKGARGRGIRLPVESETKLLASLYMASGVHEGKGGCSMTEAVRRVGRLLNQSRSSLAGADGTGAAQLTVDGPLLVRFLASGGRLDV